MKLARSTILSIGVLVLCQASAGAAPLSTAFTYQGQVKLDGSPMTGSADFQFTLWDAASGPTQVAGPVAVNGVSVADGLFTAQIDFGAGVFNGDSRWLEVAVRSPAGSGSFTTLAPRQPLTAQPYSLQTRGIFVADGGNVGIGTTTPGEKLTVAGSVEIGTNNADYQHLRIGGGNSSGFLYGSYPLFGDGIHIGYNFYADASGVPHVINLGGGSSRISMGYDWIDLATGSGHAGNFPYYTGLHIDPYVAWFPYGLQVGLGITNPQYTLDVFGGAAKPGGGSWSNNSDIRLKRNVQPLQGSLDQLLSLRGVTFEYVDPQAIHELEGTRIGMIAQEVEQVFPDWVGQRTDGYKSVTYRGFEALTVEALRDLREEKDGQFHEQEARISALEAENAEIRAANAALSARLDALESLLGTLADQSRGGVR